MATYAAINGDTLTLASGQKVDKIKLEREIRNICHYVDHVVIALKDNEYPVAMIFPNVKLFSKPDYEKSPEEGCFCPRNLTELGRCLSGCLNSINQHLIPGLAKINGAVIINAQLSVKDGTMTPDLHPVVEKVIEQYRDYLENLSGKKIVVSEEAFYMKL